MSLAGRTLFITGASRGIGLAIALKAARQGANIAIAAKTSTSNAKLPGTIYTAADDIEKAGGQALPLVVDVREESMVRNAIAKTVSHFGRLDIVVNNASAISLSTVEHTEMRRFDLMHQVNARGAFLVSKYAIPHLARGENPHILMISPPLDMKEKWFAPATAYAMAKFGMSLVALGLAGELRPKAIAVNTLWPRTTIATSAIRNLLGGERMMHRSRSPEIMAEAACRIFQKPAYSFTGRFLIDDIFLAAEGIKDFDQYRVDPSQALALDFFVPDDRPPPIGVSLEPISAAPSGITAEDDKDDGPPPDLGTVTDINTDTDTDTDTDDVIDVGGAVHTVADTDANVAIGENTDVDSDADNDADGKADSARDDDDVDADDHHVALDDEHDGEPDDDQAESDSEEPLAAAPETATEVAAEETSGDVSEDVSNEASEETDPTLRALERQLLGRTSRRG